MEGSYTRRTLGHLNRRKIEPVEKVITPNDELSSWLGDDVCSHCSGPAKGGQLYCSNECRQQDEQLSTSNVKSAAAKVDGGAASVVGSTKSESNPKFTSSSSQRPSSAESSQAQDPKQTTTSSSQDDRSFRYPCPPSPNLLAQYQSSSALTSPALTAFQRSLPQQGRGRPHQPSNTASSDQSSAQPQRRSSSQSTYSSNSASASEAAYTTDPSTTSPNAGGAVSDDDLEPSDLYLPPSAASASLVLLKSNGGTLRSTSGASSNAHASPQPQGTSSNPSPSSSTSATASGPTSMKSPVATFNGAGSSMKYTRRPSSTHLPPPVLYSPALTPTSTSKINIARAQTSSSIRQVKHFSPHSHGVDRKLIGGERQQLREMRRHSDDATDGKVSDGNQIRSALDAGKTEARATTMMRSQTDRTGERSPTLGSTASSTSKTVHALSPRGTILAVCGRFGCQGSSTRRESFSDLASSSLRSTLNTISRRASSPIPSPPSPPSPSPTRRSGHGRHQHTHSATAGLADLPRLTASAIKALTMTPALESRRAPAISSPPRPTQERGRSSGRVPSHEPATSVAERSSAFVSPSDQAIERGTPPRGRSKARGPRSTSRRSESPSRAGTSGRRLRSGSPRRGEAAVGEPLQQVQDKEPRSDSEASNPPSPLSPKSHPISITKSGRLGPLSSGRMRAEVVGASPSGVADDEKDLGGISPLALRAHRSTGRSSSRGRRNGGATRDESRGRESRFRTPAVSNEEERGRGNSRDQAFDAGLKSRAQAPKSVQEINEKNLKEVELDPGFDDVDDIEL